MQFVKIKTLSGNSGCKVTLNKIGSSFFVRKISSSVDYNNRLVIQKQKQENFHSSVFQAPKIFDAGFKNCLFYFDMEYIAGESLAQFLSHGSLPQIRSIGRALDCYFNENHRTASSTGLVSSAVFLAKVQALKIKLAITGEDLDSAFQILEKYPWPDIALGDCHGDMSCENIIVSLTKDLYLIDFLDSYCDNVCSDLSKLYLDLSIGWSLARLQHANSKNSEVRSDHLRNSIQSWSLNNDLVGFQGLIDLLRILPYVTNGADRQILEVGLKKMLLQIEESSIEHPIASLRRQI